MTIKETDNMEYMISADSVVKSYGKKQVLKGMSLDIPKGCVFGLLGPNGAGKTTFVKCTLGLTSFKSGEITICGMSPDDPRSRENVAFLPENFSFFPTYRVEETVGFFSRMHGTNKRDRAVTSALEAAGIPDLGRKRIRTLSKGQLQRVGIASLIVSDADLMILDEPFSGIDPLGMRHMKDVLRELSSRDKTILINSHILSEVEQICDRIAIMDNGVCVSAGDLDELKGTSSLEDLFCTTVKG